ncbi:hypothetical protein RB195_018885 [Necator americanus]|uniref:Uncharacterized protein n=1 Tax=Necator americanus TaxID=51031 RepID=A0ABR1CBN1_NECAM
MSAVSKEVGNKIHPASEMDDPLFHFEYGFSFISLKSSFLLTEFAALFSIVVYMAKRDERTFNRYKIRSLLKYRAKSMREKTQLELIQDCYTNHTTRFTRGRRAGISSPGSDIASFEEITSPIKLEKKRSEETSGAAQHPELLIPDFGKGDPRTKRHAEIKSESEQKNGFTLCFEKRCLSRNKKLVCNGISSTNWDKEPSVALEKSVSVQPEELPHSSWTTEMYFQVPNKIHRNAAHFCNTPTCVNYLNPKKKTYDYLGIIGSCCKMLFGVPLDN